MRYIDLDLCFYLRHRSALWAVSERLTGQIIAADIAYMRSSSFWERHPAPFSKTSAGRARRAGRRFITTCKRRYLERNCHA
jgi:hypothetical protein